MIKKVAELILYILSLITVIVLGIVFKSSIWIILNSALGMTTIYLFSQGSIWANVTGIAQLGFYTYLTIINRYYAELVGIFALSLTSYVASLIIWSRHNDKGLVKVAKGIKSWEWPVLLSVSALGGVGMYFLFGLFSTANLLLNSILFSVSCIDGYLKVRRCSLSFAFMLIRYALSFGLWFTLVIGGNLSYLSTSVNYVFYIIFSVISIINWEKLRKNEIVSTQQE